MGILDLKSKDLEALKLFLYRTYSAVGVVFIPLFTWQLLPPDTLYYTTLMLVFPVFFALIVTASYLIDWVRIHLDFITFIFHLLLTLFVILILFHYDFQSTLILGFVVLVGGVLFTLQAPVYVVIYTLSTALVALVAYSFAGNEETPVVLVLSIVLLFGFTAYVVTRYKTLLVLRLVSKERSAKENELRYKTLLNNMNEGVMQVDLEDRVIYVNTKFTELLGYSLKDLIGKKANEILLSDESQRNIIAQANAERKEGKSGQFEIKMIRKDGEELWVHTNGTPMYNEHNKVVGSLGIIRDISKERKQNLALQKSERRFRRLFENTLAGVFRIAIDGRILECNNAFATILGYNSREEVLRKRVQDLYYNPTDREKFLADLQKKDFLAPYELQHKRKDGTPVYVMVNVTLVRDKDHEPDYIEGTSIDISDLKQIEQERQRKWERDKHLIENLPYGIVIEVDGVIVFLNSQASDMFGFENTQKAIGEKGIADFLLPEHREAHQKRLKELHDGKDLSFVEVNLKTVQGKETVLEAKSLLFDFEGQLSVQTVFHDLSTEKLLKKEKLRAQVAEDLNKKLEAEITDRKSAQRELKAVQEFTQNIIDTSLDMIIATDAKGRISLFNIAAQRHFGYSAKEVLGSTTRFLYGSANEGKKVKSGLAEDGIFKGEITNITKKGKEFTTYLTAARLLDENGNVEGVMGISRDITEIKAADAVIKQSEERYRELFDNATDLIQSVDMKGNVLFVNKAWKKTLGYSERDVKSVKLKDIVLPAEYDSYMKLFKVAATGKPQENVKTTFVGKNKKEFVLIGNINPRYKGDKIHSLHSIFRNVTETEKTERILQQQAARIRSIFESSSHLIWSVDKDMHLTSFNQNFSDNVYRIYGVRPVLHERIVPLSDTNKVYERFWIDKYNNTFNGQQQQFESKFMNQEGETSWEEIFLQPIYGLSGEVTGVSGISQPITDKKIAEKQIRDQAAKIKSIFDSASNMMMWTVNNKYQLTSFNKNLRDTIYENLGTEIKNGDNFLEVMFPFMDEKMQQGLKAAYHATLEGKPGRIEGPVNAKNGGALWYETFLNPIHVDAEEGAVEEISLLAHEITDKITHEKEIKQSLKEKEVLLKEVHHRVKNNLQVISSILNLQSSYVKDPKIIEVLRESQNRIKSMSFIHENLYQRENLSSINFSEYISNLSKSLVHSYQLFEGLVDLNLELEEVYINLDKAIPCGLIVNELISNSLKYAFPKKESGSIFVKVSSNENKLTMNIGDTGIGLPDGFDYKETGTLGLQLVQTLVEQIDGNLELKKSNGTNYLITFDYN